MPRRVVSTVLALVLAFSAVRLAADSKPALSGVVAGIELCPQFICGFALFVGGFEGELNSRPASGAFAATVTHDPLPAPLSSAAITGGQWTITAGRCVLHGDVVDGSILTLLSGTQFCVTMELEITSGGKGQLFFTGLLDHGPFPPTIAGVVGQSPAPCSILAAGN